MIDDILTGIQKPGRYIGQEWNVSKKPFTQAEIKFALCFPDLYEVGMSNLGIRILYGILNNISDVACERFFAPAGDLEQFLRQAKLELFSLESQKGLSGFDLAGISLSHELCYTNALNILDLGGLPLEAALRDQRYPLVIGGGPCVLNPEPMQAFFDFFLIGEAEEAIGEIVDAYRKIKKEFKSGQMPKAEALSIFAKIEGVYVPSQEALGRKIKKRIIKDFDTAFFPAQWLVPYIQIVHDRITLELTRGCFNQCRFCQAKQQYFPWRFRKPQTVIDLAKEAYKNSGYEELSLVGLSVSDYPEISRLLSELITVFRQNCVGVSLPSIKPKDIVGNLSSLIATIKKTGLTFAPEAGTAKLRLLLGKDFDEENFFKGLEEAFAAGYQHVKLYFMIGLPFEEESDLDAIVEFALKVSALRKKIARVSAQVNISINTLIPKPHTAFQWFAMTDPDTISKKQDYLKSKMLAYKKIRFSFHQRDMSFLEGVLSRADKALGPVIANAFKRGSRFDAWEDRFNFSIWLSAFKDAGVNPRDYLKQEPRDARLAWDFLDLGVSKDTLLAEYDKLIASK